MAINFKNRQLLEAIDSFMERAEHPEDFDVVTTWHAKEAQKQAELAAQTKQLADRYEQIYARALKRYGSFVSGRLLDLSDGTYDAVRLVEIGPNDIAQGSGEYDMTAVKVATAISLARRLGFRAPIDEESASYLDAGHVTMPIGRDEETEVTFLYKASQYTPSATAEKEWIKANAYKSPFITENSTKTGYTTEWQAILGIRTGIPYKHMLTIEGEPVVEAIVNIANKGTAEYLEWLRNNPV